MCVFDEFGLGEVVVRTPNRGTGKGVIHARDARHLVRTPRLSLFLRTRVVSSKFELRSKPMRQVFRNVERSWARAHSGLWWRALCFALAIVVVTSTNVQVLAQQSEPTPKKTPKAKVSLAAQAAYSDAANIQNNGEFALAVTEWQRFLKKYPQAKLAPQARHYLGVCLLQLGKFAEAGKAFEQVVQLYPEFEFIDESHLNLGWCQYSAAVNGQTDQFAAAEATFKGFLQRREESDLRDQALFYLGECLYLQGKKPEAVPFYQELVDKHPDSKLRPDTLYALGVAQQELSDASAANETFATFLSAYSDHELFPEIKMRKAESLLKLEEYADAEKLFADVAQDKDFVDYHHALFRQAFCVLKQGRDRDAAELYSEISNSVTEPHFFAAAAVAAGRAYYQSDDIAEATKWFEKALQQRSTASEAAHWLCRIALANKQFDRAQQLASAALARAKDDAYVPSLKMDLADAIYESPDGKPKALAQYLEIVRDHGEEEVARQALYNAAYASMELEQYGDAILQAEDFERRFADHRLIPDVRYVSAESHLLSGKHAAAERLYTSLARDFPTHKQNGLWRLRHGAALQVQDKHAATLKLVDKELQSLKDPQLVAEAHYLAGYSHAKLGQNEQAVESFEASLQSSTNWRRADDAVLQLSQTLNALGKNEQARQVFERYQTSVETSDRPDAVGYQLAETHYESGDYQQALQAYDQLLQQWPDSEFVPGGLFGKAWSQFKLGKPSDAASSFTELIDGYASHQLVARAYRARGMCRQLAGDPTGGLEDVRAYLATDPPDEDRAEALYIRGLCESALKQVDAARATFTSILSNYADYNRRDRVLYELAWLHKSANEPDEASQRFAELVKQYSDSRLASEAHYHLAEHAYKQQAYAQASQSYSNALAASPSAEIAERALYKRGWCEYQQESYETAAESFREQVQRFESGRLRSDGQFMVVECLYNLRDYPQTIDAFRALDLAQITEQSRILAHLHAGQSAVQLKQWLVAIELLRPVATEIQSSALAGKAAFELARAYQGLERFEDAEKLFREVSENWRNSVGARSLFMLGELYFARQDFEPALEEFQRVMYGYGGERAPAAIKVWQAKAGLEAGRAASVLAGQTEDRQQRIEFIQQARKCFDYVVDHHTGTNEATVAAAQRKKLGP